MTVRSGRRNWSTLRVDGAQFDETAGLLRGLLIRLDDRLTPRDVALISEFIDVGELVLALEQTADGLSEDELAVTRDERADMHSLATRMRMDDRVPQALTFCPPR